MININITYSVTNNQTHLFVLALLLNICGWFFEEALNSFSSTVVLCFLLYYITDSFTVLY